ncbi:nucleoside hydrolase [Erwinia persicina]|uniref:nucleoside hydrolase n=1 Tax=Erwinia persicina TaxID=55211 RepID=UPI000788BCEF|nr:nucleoside hydrolase [Erwinia persicina]
MVKKIIIDCDPGIDDAIAILLAIADPEIKLMGITTIAGNISIDKTFKNARKITELAGKSDIPVFKGTSRPLMFAAGKTTMVHGENGLGGIELPEPVQEDSGYHAVDFIIKTVMENPGEIIICPIGPLTNIALALIKEPALADNIKDIVLMGGAAFCPGNITAYAEFNFYVDPHAAHIVFDTARHVTMLGLDVTEKVDIRKGLCNILETGNHVAQISASMSRVYAMKDPYLHDPCAIAYVINPGLFSGIKGSIEIDYTSKEKYGQCFARTEKELVNENAIISNERPLYNVNIILDVDSKALLELISSNIMSF